MKMLQTFICAVVLIATSSCGVAAKRSITAYAEAAPAVRLGMSKAKVLEILAPSQEGLTARLSKQPDIYKKDGVIVEILYFRSGWQSDGLTTDDEFTPYVFNDGELVAIGWATLGGPKTRGQVVPEVNVNVQQTVQ